MGCTDHWGPTDGELKQRKRVRDVQERVKDMPIGDFPVRLHVALYKLFENRSETAVRYAEKIAAFLDGTEESDKT